MIRASASIMGDFIILSRSLFQTRRLHHIAFGKVDISNRKSLQRKEDVEE